jgi:RecB family endonuclease NucS
VAARTLGTARLGPPSRIYADPRGMVKSGSDHLSALCITRLLGLPLLLARRYSWAMWIEYHYGCDAVSSHRALSHTSVLQLLAAACEARKFSGWENREHPNVLPQNDRDRALLDACRDFAMRRHVRLRLGSANNPYGWFPPQLLIVRDDNHIEAIVPCEIEGKQITPEEFLSAVPSGEAWSTVTARRRNEKGPHRRLVDSILADSSCLEPGLVLTGQNAWVADQSGETGYIDLVFRDARGSYLLIEVKVTPSEIDKGIGQLLKQGLMFAQQNFLGMEHIRLALACPEIPPVRRLACGRAGVECFQLPQSGEATLVR